MAKVMHYAVCCLAVFAAACSSESTDGPCGVASCAAGFEVDFDACECIAADPIRQACPIAGCLPGHILNPATCSCAPKPDDPCFIESCEPGYVLDVVACRCVDERAEDGPCLDLICDRGVADFEQCICQPPHPPIGNCKVECPGGVQPDENCDCLAEDCGVLCFDGLPNNGKCACSVDDCGVLCTDGLPHNGDCDCPADHLDGPCGAGGQRCCHEAVNVADEQDSLTDACAGDLVCCPHDGCVVTCSIGFE